MKQTEPRIEILSKKKMLGIQVKTSLSNNKTGELWQRFMTRKKEIKDILSDDRYAIQIYDRSYFEKFNPKAEFVKWATVEVADFENVPNGMETFILKSGLYAVFEYKGSSEDKSIFQYIYTSWLPNSDYLLDDRPHFEVLGKKYKNNDPNSEEEIWIPIKLKN